MSKIKKSYNHILISLRCHMSNYNKWGLSSGYIEPGHHFASSEFANFLHKISIVLNFTILPDINALIIRINCKTEFIRKDNITSAISPHALQFSLCEQRNDLQFKTHTHTSQIFKDMRDIVQLTVSVNMPIISFNISLNNLKTKYHSLSLMYDFCRKG